MMKNWRPWLRNSWKTNLIESIVNTEMAAACIDRS
jgi:hypothetical protein